MKKAITKFKHWLIKKLGGFAYPITCQPVVHTNQHDIITLESRVAVSEPSASGYSNTMCNDTQWFKDNNPRDIMVLKGALADKIVEMGDEYIQFTHDYDPISDRVFIRARIRIVKNK